MLILKCKNADILQSEFKYYITEISEKDKIIQDFEIKFMKKQNKLAVIKKKIKKAE